MKLGALLEVKENSGLAFLHFEHGEAMVAHPVFATWGSPFRFVKKNIQRTKRHRDDPEVIRSVEKYQIA